MKKVLFIFGTRPEAIKMAPLVKAFQKDTQNFETKVCVTAQHRSMLDQVLDFFEIKPDYDLDLMLPGQTLFDITARVLKGLEKVLDDCEPEVIFVQGDTTTVFVGALAGFYKKIKIAHIEAGLRSNNKYSPFPEEINRKLTGHMTDYHFAPTEKAVKSLRKEGITENVWQVGNTVIDALFLGLKIIKEQGEDKYYDFFKDIDFNKKIILVTSHRRESFGKPFEEICEAIKEIAEAYPAVEIVYPVHLNPNVQKTVKSILKNIKNVHLIDPLNYPYLIWLMQKAYLVLTDSGGIQEEAPSLGKPVLVMRDVTERMEGVEAGTAKLVGTDRQCIIKNVTQLLDDQKVYAQMAQAVNPYGEGTTSQQVLEIMREI
ncbi:UDP-N-acetylglucosamine 2-epimerase (non-hydrolyzing) [bacterium]|jgi:UDP-N-acetylglucosamine 2-epimerase (non-hydrolysing)|nr:UDP-N-acetylglucosamine 2-epimerase (non-hydrolyzing) [bacterium]MBT3581939.1 UDP-N-acetylglucosamine 2-epimerase (non-hydrolyzing) [bacterium]MBT4551708.1 UDP-N-acetylglucosamine 2-epimerase (non-hydrolyzing) [bacterium]MBT7088562.1 UDP-N-acetylglucosamine 2-epimerase (non-hydrolyzing) [bacterium]